MAARSYAFEASFSVLKPPAGREAGVDVTLLTALLCKARHSCKLGNVQEAGRACVCVCVRVRVRLPQEPKAMFEMNVSARHFRPAQSFMCRVGQDMHIFGVCTVVSAGKCPSIRYYTVYPHRSGQSYA
jgi:hypothetical protein